MTVLLVALGGAAGAVLRYLADRAVRTRSESVFPCGTFMVNIAGSLLLGGLTGAAGDLPGGAGALLGTGLCGALTTYSTFGYETVRLVEGRAGWYAAGYAAASVGGGLAAAFAGVALGAAV